MSGGPELQLLVFDTRRGNAEGREQDKLLAFFPPSVPPVQQSGLAGLLHGLLLFTANFTSTLVGAELAGSRARALQTKWSMCMRLPACLHTANHEHAPACWLLTPCFWCPPLQRPRWDVAETDSGLWVMHEPEPHIWFAAVSAALALCALAVASGHRPAHWPSKDTIHFS